MRQMLHWSIRIPSNPQKLLHIRAWPDHSAGRGRRQVGEAKKLPSPPYGDRARGNASVAWFGERKHASLADIHKRRGRPGVHLADDACVVPIIATSFPWRGVSSARRLSRLVHHCGNVPATRSGASSRAQACATSAVWLMGSGPVGIVRYRRSSDTGSAGAVSSVGMLRRRIGEHCQAPCYATRDDQRRLRPLPWRTTTRS